MTFSLKALTIKAAALALAVAAIPLLIHTTNAQPQTADPPRRSERAPSAPSANQDDEDDRAQSREERNRWRQRAMQDYESDMKGKPDRLNFYVHVYKEKNILNFKSVPFDVKAQSMPDGSVSLEGEVLYQEHKAAVEDVLNSLGFTPIKNSIIVLPDNTTLGDKPFAISTTSTLSLWREPRVRSEQVNQVLLGAPLRLLKKAKDDKFYYVQSHDDYVGWVEASSILPVDKSQWTLWRNTWPKAIIQRPIALQKFLPLTHQLHSHRIWEGTLLPVNKNGLEEELVLPGGEKIPLARLQRGIDYDILAAPNVEDMRNRLRSMSEPYLGVRYRWGGITPEGFDCSGFTRHIYQKLNVYLGRDADQQAVSGELTAFRGYRDGLLPGDLLFFVGRRGNVSHVAMSLGGMDYVHSAGRGVHYASFEQESPLYNERYDRSFAFAKRVLPRGLPPAPAPTPAATTTNGNQPAQ